METTRLSSKGQVILPKSIRHSHRWKAGLQFAVEDLAGGVFLKPLKPFKPTRLADVIGCTRYKGPRKTLDDMEIAIAKGAVEHK